MTLFSRVDNYYTLPPTVGLLWDSNEDDDDYRTNFLNDLVVNQATIFYKIRGIRKKKTLRSKTAKKVYGRILLLNVYVREPIGKEFCFLGLNYQI